MSRIAPLVALLLLAWLTPPPSAAEGDGGIAWETDVASGLARAAAEGRPVLLALNALEDERANQQLALELYRSRAWGLATEDWVCLPCNPNGHGTDACTRYEGIPCETHQEALRLLYRLRRLPTDRTVISPAHAVLDPDGRLVWEKEYFTGVVGPRLFESLLSRLSPSLALDRAARLRVDSIVRLEETPAEALGEAVGAWLAKDDPLAAAGVVVAADQELDPGRRLALVRALARAPVAASDLVQVGAYEASLLAGEEPELALAWLEAAAALDAEAARGHRMRAAFRAGDEGLRRRMLGVGGPGKGPEERQARVELDLLLGRRPATGRPDAAGDEMAGRLARARRLGLGEGRQYPTLGSVADDAPPAVLRGSLLEAEPDEVREHAGVVRRAFRERREERVRIAAALALLGAGLDEAGEVPPTIRAAVFDAVEGEDTRREALSRLEGKDPGWNEESWTRALQAAVGGSR